MKLWIDDVRHPPKGYAWARSVNEAITMIKIREDWSGFPAPCSDAEPVFPFELIDIDHDAGEYACDGGDYIKVLDWLEETGRKYPIRVHSMNPVGVQKMLTICNKNNWIIVR